MVSIDMLLQPNEINDAALDPKQPASSRPVLVKYG